MRIAVEERVELSPDALTGMEANLRFAGPETMETKIFGRLSAWQNWIFQRPNAVGERGALTLYGRPERARVRLDQDVGATSINVHRRPDRRRSRTTSTSSSDKRLQRALEQWQPQVPRLVEGDGPDGFQDDDIYLRTAISVDAEGWAHFDYVKMPDYRWGIFLADPVPDRKIGFGDNIGKPVWQEVPGEHRNVLRRLIVTQGDTEPASVEQQRLLGHTCPEPLRPAQPVPGERRGGPPPLGDGLPAPQLLRPRRPRGGRGAARSAAAATPTSRASSAPSTSRATTGSSFFMFTMFTDRDGKYQLLALAESGFDPLSRTTRFMLTEEAHHMFVGETGVGRIVAAHAPSSMKHGPQRGRARPGRHRPADMMQKYMNLWYSLSLDLFGGEISSATRRTSSPPASRAAPRRTRYEDHTRAAGHLRDGWSRRTARAVEEDVPLRNAMNEVLRDEYVEDCQRGVDRWNKRLVEAGVSPRLRLPSKRFYRHIGLYAGMPFDLDGELLAREEWDKRKGEWLPTEEDRAYVATLQKPVREPGKIANWLARPARGIKGLPFEYEYVRLD